MVKLKFEFVIVQKPKSVLSNLWYCYNLLLLLFICNVKTPPTKVFIFHFARWAQSQMLSWVDLESSLGKFNLNFNFNFNLSENVKFQPKN